MNVSRGQMEPLTDRAAFVALLILGVGFPFEPPEALINLRGAVILTTVETLILLALLLWAVALIMAWRLPRLPRPIVLPAGFWLSSLVLSALLAPTQRLAASLFLMRVIGGLLVGWMVYDQAVTSRRIRLMMGAMALAGLLVAIFGVAEASNLRIALRWLLQFKEAQTRLGDVIRVSSTLSYATIAAMVLELTILVVVGLLLEAKARWQQIAGWLAIGLMALTLTLTLSRAGIVALGVGLAVMLGMGLWRRQRRVAIAGASAGGMLLALVGVVLVWNPLAGLRLQSETEEAWYQARYNAPHTLAAQPGETFFADVTVTNTGIRTWQASGEQAFQLSYHLQDADGEVVTYDGARSPLPADVPPGEQVTVRAMVATPVEVGEYVIEWDMLHESVAWFSWKDTPTAISRLEVRGRLVQGLAIEQSAAPTDINVITATPGRIELWQAALLMVADRPLLGVGPDNFRWRYGDYANLDVWNTSIHANNLYLEWLADSGLPGLLAFIWLSWTLLFPLGRRLVSGPSDADWRLALGLFCGLVAWYTHGLVDFFYEFTPTYVLFWLLAGLGLRLSESAV